MEFYEDVMRQLVVALGAALFVGNVVALVRRRSDARLSAARTLATTRPGSPVRGNRRLEVSDRRDLTQAPVLRSLTYATVGFVVMLWGIATLLT